MSSLEFRSETEIDQLVVDVRLFPEKLVTKVACEGPEIFDHEVNLWLFVSKAD